MSDLKYSCKLEITSDKMAAYLLVENISNDGIVLDENSLLDLLKSHNITFGIIESTIKKICESPNLKERYLIAHGKKPVSGKDGHVEFLIDFDNNFEPKVLDDGRVDYKELQIFKSIKKDEIIAKKIEPEDGIDGMNIFGEIVKANKGKDAKLPLGKNTYIKDDCLFSSIDGHIFKKDQKVNVNPLIELKDVNASTGNIRTFASIKIYNNISSGYKIESDGDIEIYGVVERSTIIAKGNIIIHRGVQGSGKAKIISGGKIVSKYLQNCDITAEGDVVSEAIMYSNVKSNSSVKLIGSKGLIVGSVVIAAREIEATNVGSKMYVQTELIVGESPEKRKRKEEIINKIAENEKSIDGLNKIILYLNKIGIPEDKKAIYEKTLKSLLQLENENRLLYDEYKELNSDENKESYGIIKVHDTVYPGTKITIDDVSRKIKDPIKYVTFMRNGADIDILPIG